MKMSDEKTTISVTKAFRDTVKEHREYPNEPLEKVLQRELSDVEQSDTDLEELERTIKKRIDDEETALTTQIERLQG